MPNAPAVSVTFVMTAVGAVLFASTQIVPQLLQTNYAYTAYLAGLSMMAGGVAMLVMMPVSGALSSRVQPKYMMAAGMGIVAVFEHRSWRYVLINGGYLTVALTVMGAILGGWR